jgi:uncharacterized phage-like protein YoqJ
VRNKTCCFTGHRKIPPEQYIMIAKRLKTEIIRLVEDGYVYFAAGGALGFDTMAAKAVLELKETTCPQIRLILVLPCKTQTRGWDMDDVVVYEDIKARCDKFVYTSEEYTRGCMFKRNRHLVDNSSVCICYLTESKGGTAYTVNYANEKGLSITNLSNNE